MSIATENAADLIAPEAGPAPVPAETPRPDAATVNLIKSYFRDDSPDSSNDPVDPADWLPCGGGWRHRTAFVSPSANIGQGVLIYNLATVEAGATIGVDGVIGPRASVGRNAQIGQGVIVKPRARIGLGVKIGSDARIGIRTVVNDGAKLGDGVTIDDRVWIGHRVQIGDRVHVSEYASIGEGAVIGDGCVISRHAGVSLKCKLGESVIVHAKAGVGDGCTVDAGVIIREDIKIPRGQHIKATPLRIEGTEHDVVHVGKGLMKIGCQTHSLDDWEENIIEIGIDHGYDDDQIEEYASYLELVKKRDQKLYGDDKTNG